MKIRLFKGIYDIYLKIKIQFDKKFIFLSILNFYVNIIYIKLNIYLTIYIIVSFSLNINNTKK